MAGRPHRPAGRRVAALVALIACLIFSQLLARQATLDATEGPTLLALGMTRWQLWLAGMSRMATIVHSADVEADIDRSPQAAGLKAIAMGFRRIYGDRDHEKLEAQMSVYDALYAWCAETS